MYCLCIIKSVNNINSPSQSLLRKCNFKFLNDLLQWLQFYIILLIFIFTSISLNEIKLLIEI
jgi:hypothetical protein